MKSFNIFGKKLIIKWEEAKPESKKLENKSARKNVDPRSVIRFRLVLIFLILSIFTIFSKLDLLTLDYKVGDIAKNDIISTQQILKYKNIEKIEKLKRIVEARVGRVYKRDLEKDKKIYEKFNIFFDKVKKINKNSSSINLQDEIMQKELKIDLITLKTILDINDIEEFKSKLKLDLDTILEKGVYSSGKIDFKKYFKGKETLKTFEKDIINQIIDSNQIHDEKATKAKIGKMLTPIINLTETIELGQVIVEKGDPITEEDLRKMKEIGIYSVYDNLKIILGLSVYLLLISILFYFIIKKYLQFYVLENKIYYSTLIVIVIMQVILKLLNLDYIFVFPFGGLVLILGIIASEKYSLIFSTMNLLFLFAFSGFDYRVLAVSMVSLIIGLYYIKRIKNRTDIVNAGISIGVISVLLGLAFSLILKEELLDMIISLIQLLGSGLLAGMITIALLPYFENSFNILTDIKLLELGDFSNPLLKQLLIEAPGTFHHSILVATLSESAAEAIGANAIFARVAAYYHDIGKMKRPNFFVENQKSLQNPHNKLNPYLSSLIITSHIKDGNELAKRNKIPKEIRDVIREHHGTTMLAYFYNEAKKDAEDLNESDFRYEGPKPRSKESAIIMLADSIEAAVRSLEDKNSVAVENMIRKIVHGKVDDGQLSTAELTFKDIEVIIRTFIKVLQGIYHSRIKYPNLEKLKKANS